MSSLDVYLHHDRVGALERLSQAQLRFSYEESWVERAGAPLSLSLPVRHDPFDDDECRPFFSGLLPEGGFLRAVARAYHVSAQNSFALLSEIGGECAGAVSLAAPGEQPPFEAQSKSEWLTDEALAKVLDELPDRPLLAGGNDGFRLSLAGAQDKLPVLADAGRIGLTRGNPPSTHILKTPIERLADTVVNEAYCLAIASEIGLTAADAAPRSVMNREFLCVRRYDRLVLGDSVRRLHQEDFCQALGFGPHLKYENEGGPSVADCARLIREHSGAPAVDLLAFADALVYNFLIGNHDAHSKNYSLLLEGENAPRLAPLYDLISTAVYPGSTKKLAMKYGGEYRPRYVRGRHLDRLAGALEISPRSLRRRIARTTERTVAALPAARSSLPAGCRNRDIIESVDATVRERSEWMTGATAET